MSDVHREDTSGRTSPKSRILWSVALYGALGIFGAVEALLMLSPHFPPHNAVVHAASDLVPFVTPLILFAVALVPLAWFSARLSRLPVPLVGLVVVAVVARLAYLALRISFSDMVVDNDVKLVFGYAEQFAGGTYPNMEYPQVALLYFWAAYRLAGGMLDSFRVVLPLLNLACDVLVIACVWGVATRFRAKQTAWVLSLFIALSPFSLILWFSKFDALPAALFALAMYFFVVRREELSGVALAIGFFAKWFPALAAPVLLAHLLRRRAWSALVRLALALAAMAALIGLPFWLADSQKFLFTYRFHADRGGMAESIFYLPVYWLEPLHRLQPGKLPWDGFESGIFSNSTMTAIQFGVIGVLVLVALVARGSRSRAIKLASLAVLAFIVLNRVFSPQYAVVMLASYSVSLSTQPLSRVALVPLALALLFLTAANMFVWPFLSSFWLESSVVFFSLSLLLSFTVLAASLGKENGPTPATASDT